MSLQQELESIAKIIFDAEEQQRQPNFRYSWAAISPERKKRLFDIALAIHIALRRPAASHDTNYDGC